MFEYLRGKTVVITGVGGFIGSHLVRRMLDLGAVVVAIDNYLTGRKENLASLFGPDGVALSPNLKHIIADVTKRPYS